MLRLAIPGPCFIQLDLNETGNTVFNDNGVSFTRFLGNASGGVRVLFKQKYRECHSDFLGSEGFDRIYTGSEAALEFTCRMMEFDVLNDAKFYDLFLTGPASERRDPVTLGWHPVPFLTGQSVMRRYAHGISVHVPYWRTMDGKTARIKFFRCVVINANVHASSRGYEYNYLVRVIPVTRYDDQGRHHQVLFGWRYV